jgi:hypothetical protein
MTRSKGEHQEQAALKRTDVSIRNLSLALQSQTGKQQTLLSLRTDVSNPSPHSKHDLVLRARVQDPDGTVLRTEQSKLQLELKQLPAHANRQVFLSLEIETPRLWAQDLPEQYELQLTIEDRHGRVHDTLVRAFGIRQFYSGHYRIKQMGQHIAMAPSDEGADTFWIANQFDYISLDRFEPHWELQEDGSTIAQGKLDPMPVPPGQSIKIALPVSDVPYKATAHYEYVLSFRPVVNTMWGPAEQSVTTGKLRIQQ